MKHTMGSRLLSLLLTLAMLVTLAPGSSGWRHSGWRGRTGRRSRNDLPLTTSQLAQKM